MGAPSSPRETGSHAPRPLLLLVCEPGSLAASVRSGDRDVRTWAPDDAAASADSFGGDPTDPAAFEWTRAARGVTAIFDLQPAERARQALTALRRVRPDAAVLLLSGDVAELDQPRDGTLARHGRLRDVLRLDLDEELDRLEAERRAYCLREFARGDAVVPILIHPDPDPDAMSAALAVATLLGGKPDRTPIVTTEDMTRPENVRMAELLRLRVTRVTKAELRRFDRLITVDTQPRDLQLDGRPRLAVIDHHPPEQGYTAEFADIRPWYGATATMLTEYLRAVDPDAVYPGLATALLYGIKTDTDSLIRAVSPADVAAYAFLQERADLRLVRRFERPSYALDSVRLFGRTLAGAECHGDLCVAWVGDLDEDDGHVLADLADFCLGIENVTWAAVAAVVDGELVVTLRHAGGGPGAGGLARALANGGGSGGGHSSMGRAVLSEDRARAVLHGDQPLGALQRMLRDAMTTADDAASRPESPRARPA
jgi:nanoRNase/pAp phosphatase (c-di-AMP/oligoRNAs hydrolase)